MDFFRHLEVVRPEAPLLRWMEEHHPEKIAPGALPTSWGVHMDDAQRPSEREMRENSRSRSAVLHVLRKQVGLARMVDLERIAYPLRGWKAPPSLPGPPPVTFEYEDAMGRGGEKRKKEKKKEKKEKKRGSKWAEC